MRYIDTGSRDPKHALGFWLDKNVLRDSTVQELRWQTGFFDSNSLGFFAPSMKRLRVSNGILRVLVGSNDGMTRRADVEDLLLAAGPRRRKQRIGIVHFRAGYYHPKTVHIVRKDGSAAAYVGSANLTQNGVASLHIEAGLLLDTREKDDPGVLAQIADAIDWWFVASRPGLNVIANSAQLPGLVAKGILNVPPPPSPKLTPRAKSAAAGAASLKHLLKIPALPTKGSKLTAPRPAIVSVPAQWRKKLSASDAQRKGAGNQRGSITLVQAGYPINAQIYFRQRFFAGANWRTAVTMTGKTMENATVPMTVTFLGNNLGILNMNISHESGRQSGQANYTSLLHLGALAPHFAANNVTGRLLELNRQANGRYTLSIQ